MNKICSIAICIVFSLFFIACSAADGNKESTATDDIFSFSGGDLEEFAAHFSPEEIEYVIYSYTSDTVISLKISDSKEIKQLFEAISQIRVGTMTDIRATDSEESFTFVMNDETSYTITFEQHNLLLDGNAYRLTEDTELWKLARRLNEQHSAG